MGNETFFWDYFDWNIYDERLVVLFIFLNDERLFIVAMYNRKSCEEET